MNKMEDIIRHSKSMIEDRKALNRRLVILESIKQSNDSLMELIGKADDSPEADRLLEKVIRSIKRYIEEKKNIENQLSLLDEAERLNNLSIGLFVKLQELIDKADDSPEDESLL